MCRLCDKYLTLTIAKRHTECAYYIDTGDFIMIVPDAKEKWSGRVNPVTIGATKAQGGTRGRTVTIGGADGIPFLKFDGQTPHPPVIALDVLDKPPAEWPRPLEEVYSDVWSDPAAWARRR